MEDRIYTPIRNMTNREKLYPTFPGIIRPGGGSDSKCNDITGVQI